MRNLGNDHPRRTTDPHGASYEQDFAIEVIDLDEDVPVLTLLGSAT